MSNNTINSYPNVLVGNGTTTGTISTDWQGISSAGGNTYTWPPYNSRPILTPGISTPSILLGEGLDMVYEGENQVIKISEQIRYAGIMSIKQDEKNLLVRKGYDVDNLNKMLAGTKEDIAFANDIIEKNTSYLFRILHAEVFNDNTDLDRILLEYYFKNKGKI